MIDNLPGKVTTMVHRRNLHQRVHLCVVCGKKFSLNANLMMHMRVHTGERPYACSLCSKDFADYSNCIKHVRNHGPEGGATMVRRKFCYYCREHFVSPERYMKHTCPGSLANGGTNPPLFMSEHNKPGRKRKASVTPTPEQLKELFGGLGDTSLGQDLDGSATGIDNLDPSQFSSLDQSISSSSTSPSSMHSRQMHSSNNISMSSPSIVANHLSVGDTTGESETYEKKPIIDTAGDVIDAVASANLKAATEQQLARASNGSNQKNQHNHNPIGGLKHERNNTDNNYGDATATAMIGGLDFLRFQPDRSQNNVDLSFINGAHNFLKTDSILSAKRKLARSKSKDNNSRPSQPMDPVLFDSTFLSNFPFSLNNVGKTPNAKVAKMGVSASTESSFTSNFLAQISGASSQPFSMSDEYSTAPFQSTNVKSQSISNTSSIAIHDGSSSYGSSLRPTDFGTNNLKVNHTDNSPLSGGGSGNSSDDEVSGGGALNGHSEGDPGANQGSSAGADSGLNLTDSSSIAAWAEMHGFKPTPDFDGFASSEVGDIDNVGLLNSNGYGNISKVFSDTVTGALCNGEGNSAVGHAHTTTATKIPSRGFRMSLRESLMASRPSLMVNHRLSKSDGRNDPTPCQTCLGRLDEIERKWTDRLSSVLCFMSELDRKIDIVLTNIESKPAATGDDAPANCDGLPLVEDPMNATTKDVCDNSKVPNDNLTNCNSNTDVKPDIEQCADN